MSKIVVSNGFQLVSCGFCLERFLPASRNCTFTACINHLYFVYFSVVVFVRQIKIADITDAKFLVAGFFHIADTKSIDTHYVSMSYNSSTILENLL